jgi:tRNA(Arg) A34 adenosine deaminase TadA
MMRTSAKNDEAVMLELQEKLRKKIAGGDGCGPFYALIIDGEGAVISESANSVVGTGCSHNHAEMNAIRLAEEKLGTWNLAGRGLTLYTTAEPCMMCVGAILWCGIERVVYGVSTESVERITGFDEGFKPDWRGEFAKRGIEVSGPVLPDFGESALRDYMQLSGTGYSPKRG